MAGTLTLKRNIGTGGKIERDAMNSSGFVAFTTLDSANIDPASAPIGRPTSVSTAYSYEARLYLKVTKAPNNNFTNIRYWSNVAVPANGIVLYVGTSVASSTPINTLSVKALRKSTAYTSPDTSLLWSAKTLTNVNDISHTLIVQLRCTASAPIGDMANENMVNHWSYDES